LFRACGQAASRAPARAGRQAGDVLRYALPASVLAYELWQGEGGAPVPFLQSYGLTLAGTEILKRTTRVERPDGRDKLSFPSGHAAHAFAAATFMHRRHGFATAWPWYAAASYVGWTRVNANRHRWVDIAGSAAVSAAATWWLVEPKPQQALSLLPSLQADGVSLVMHVRW
jgi:membrane-associated phospholipid phosphatase